MDLQRDMRGVCARVDIYRKRHNRVCVRDISPPGWHLNVPSNDARRRESARELARPSCRTFAAGLSMTGANYESEDKENASQNVRLAKPTKKCEQKDDSENEKLRSENEKLRRENEMLRNAAAEAERAAASAKSQ